MKKKSFILYFRIVGCVLFLNSGCHNQAKVSGTVKTTQGEPTKGVIAFVEPSPAIEFEKVVLDFGKVGPGAKLIAEFKFTNIGDSMLEITKIGRCCGTVASLEKYKYAPGENGVLKATYNMPTQTGVYAKQLVVNSNDKTSPSVTLTMKAEVVQRIAFTPPRLQLLRDKENAGNPRLVISSLDNGAFSITGFKSTADCISTEYDPTLRASEFVLDLKIDAGKLQDKLKGTIDFTLTHPEANFVAIPFEVVPRFSVSPPLLIIFNAEPNKPIIRRVLIVNNYGEDFDIDSITSEENTIKVINRHKVSAGYEFEVQITPKAAKGETKFTDACSINIKGGGTLPLVCHGYYAKREYSSGAQ